jgi:hypothetical protein
MTRTAMTFQGKLMNLLSFRILATGALLVTTAATAAIPGITPAGNGSATTPYSIGLTASAEYSSQPDGASIYSWGYGCTSSATSN